MMIAHKYRTTGYHDVKLSGNVIATPIFGSASLKYNNPYDKIIVEFKHPMHKGTYDEPEIATLKIYNSISSDWVLCACPESSIVDFKFDMYSKTRSCIKEKISSFLSVGKTYPENYVRFAAFDYIDLLSSIYLENLKSIYLPPSIELIPYGFLSNATAMSLIYFGPSRSAHKLSSIGESAFYNCSCLNDLILPSHVKSIGKYAFNNGLSLSTLILPELLSGYDSDTSFVSTDFQKCYCPITFGSLVDDLLKDSNVPLFAASAPPGYMHRHTWEQPLGRWTGHYTSIENETVSSDYIAEMHFVRTVTFGIRHTIENAMLLVFDAQKNNIENLSKLLNSLLNSVCENSWSGKRTPVDPGKQPERSDYSPSVKPELEPCPEEAPTPPTTPHPEPPTVPAPKVESPGDEPKFDKDPPNIPNQFDFDTSPEGLKEYLQALAEFESEMAVYLAELKAYNMQLNAWRTKLQQYNEYQFKLKLYEAQLEQYESNLKAYEEEWNNYRNELKEKYAEYEEKVKAYQTLMNAYAAATEEYNEALAKWTTEKYSYDTYNSVRAEVKKIFEDVLSKNIADEYVESWTDSVTGMYKFITILVEGREPVTTVERDDLLKKLKDGEATEALKLKELQESTQKMLNSYMSAYKEYLGVASALDIYNAIVYSDDGFWSGVWDWICDLGPLKALIKGIVGLALSFIQELLGLTTQAAIVKNVIDSNITEQEEWVVVKGSHTEKFTFNRDAMWVCHGNDPYAEFQHEPLYRCTSAGSKSKTITYNASIRSDEEGKPETTSLIESSSSLFNLFEGLVAGLAKVVFSPTIKETALETAKSAISKNISDTIERYSKIVNPQPCPTTEDEYTHVCQFYDDLRFDLDNDVI